MNSPSLLLAWLQWIGLFALEVGLIAFLVRLASRWSSTAVWPRTVCRIGIISVLVIAGCEISGIARQFADRAVKVSFRQSSDLRSSHDRKDARNTSLKLGAASPEGYMMPTGQEAIAERSIALEQRTVGTIHSAPRAIPIGQTGPIGPVAAGEQRAGILSDIIYWLSVIWLAGTLLIMVRAGVARFLLVLLRLRRRRLSEPEILQRIMALADSLGFHRPIHVIESKELNSPIAFGLWRPTIGLPVGFSTRFNTEEQEAILAHELGHLAARDPFWCALADVTTAMLWWHPGLWCLRRDLQLANEIAADEASLLVRDGPGLLAKCLIDIGSRIASPPPLGHLQVSGFRSHLGQRVERLMCLQGLARTPSRSWRTRIIMVLGPLGMASLVVLCTAWASPRALTQGVNMTVMQMNWKRSLVALSLMATISNPTIPIEASELKEPASTPVPTDAGKELPSASSAKPNSTLQMEDVFRKRYGINAAETVGGPGLKPPESVSTRAHGSEKGAQVEAKLNAIILPELKLDGLPLTDVVRLLRDESRRRDPRKEGINFLINPNPPPVVPHLAIDPTTGLPATGAPAEVPDIGAVTVRIEFPLLNVSIKNLLDAIVRVADKPLEYSVEDYGVVISLKRDSEVEAAAAVSTRTSPEQMVVRTYKVDTNNFIAGLENAFGIRVNRSVENPTRTRNVVSALQELMTQLGVSFGPNKAVFYNDLTGIVMVRASLEDQGVVSAAIATLGGNSLSASGVRVGNPSVQGQVSSPAAEGGTAHF